MCRVQSAGCRVQGAGCRVQGAGFRVQGARCRVQGSECRVQGVGAYILGQGQESPRFARVNPTGFIGCQSGGCGGFEFMGHGVRSEGSRFRA